MSAAAPLTVVQVVGAALAGAAAEQAVFEARQREAERLARLTPFVLPEGLVLPPALAEAFNEFSDAGAHAHAAGVALRFSFSRAGEPDGTLDIVQAWWAAQTREARVRTEDLALVEGIHLEGDVDAFEGEALDEGVGEGLALKWDAFSCVTTLLWQMRMGWDARRAEADLRTRLSALLAAQPPGEEWASPVLDAWARRGPSWWTVAPGAAAPPLDADAFAFDEDAEEDLAEDILALADEDVLV
jgi:hypothetical protein